MCYAICIISIYEKGFFVCLYEKGYCHESYANTFWDAGRKIKVLEIRNVKTTVAKNFHQPVPEKGSELGREYRNSTRMNVYLDSRFQ